MMNNEKQYCYRYPHPALTADCVIFGFDGMQLQILLVERGNEPYKGMWALPGGFMKIDETIEESARRELREETGVENVFLSQFKTYSDVKRDPRERVVSVAFIALVRQKDFMALRAGDDASMAAWFQVEMLPPLAFDHYKIINEARQYLIKMVSQSPVAFTLLDKVFSVSEVQNVYEAITGEKYERRNFQRKLLQTGIVKEVSPEEDEQTTRARKLYSLSDRLNDEVIGNVSQPNEDVIPEIKTSMIMSSDDCCMDMIDDYCPSEAPVKSCMMTNDQLDEDTDETMTKKKKIFDSLKNLFNF